MINWLNPKLKVKKISKYGKGIFCIKKIKKNEILCIFGGYIIPVKEEDEDFDYGFQVTENLLLGLRNKKDIDDGSFFNHSCNPNAGFKGQIILVAMRDIEKDEEVTFDYAMVLSRAKGAIKYKLKCVCGAKNCRGFVTENDWKIVGLQKKYKGYFQWYLEEKIKKFSK